MGKDYKKIFEKCQINPPVSDMLLADFIKSVGKTLPDEYLGILKFSDGLEGNLNDKTYLQLWDTQTVLSQNIALKTNEFIPGMLLIGSDGGDEALGIDLREGSQTYGHFYRVPFVPLNWKEAVDLGTEIEKVTFF